MSLVFWHCSLRWSRHKRNSWRRSVGDQRLITVDELRAAGALDVPAAWRKSLQVERETAPSLFADEDAESEQERQSRVAPDAA